MTPQDTLWQTPVLSICDSPLEAARRGDLDPQHPALAFDALWRGLADGATPTRDRFSPASARTLLKWLMVFDEDTGHPPAEVSGDQPPKARYYLRLSGDAAQQLMQENFSGRYLDEFTSDTCYKTRRSLMQRCLEDGEPVFGRTDLGLTSEYRAEVTIGMFPFRAAGSKPAQVMVLAAPVKAEQRAFL